MKKNLQAIALLVILGVLLLSGCGNGEAAIIEVNENEVIDPNVDSLAVGDITFPGFTAETLDPAFASGNSDALKISELIYDRLVTVEGGEPAPGLAVSWSVSDDMLTYHFKLRANATFIDGTQISSDVVIDNFNRWFDPSHPLHGSDSSKYIAWKDAFGGFAGETEDEKPLSRFDGVEKIDNLEFLVHLNVPMDNFLTIVAQPEFSILNNAVYETEGDLHATIDGKVIGSGAYYVINWDQNGLALAENPEYWGKQ